MSKDTDVHLASITTELKFIREDISEIKEFQTNCPIHDLSKEVSRHTTFFNILIYLLSGSGFLGVLGIIAIKVVA